MANNLLTIDEITNEALMVLHQKLNFVTNIVTDYDSSYAVEGAKIGNSLRVRLPMEYGTGTGPTIATGTGADSLQNQVTLTVNTQRHVPMRFTTNERTMKIDEFRDRHIEPAMSRLAAMVEYDALSMMDECPNAVNAGTKVDFSDILAAGVILDDNLAPTGATRNALIDSQAKADMVDSLKGLFNDQVALSRQFKEAVMGRTAGFDFYQNTLLRSHTSGAAGGSSTYLTNAVTAQVGSYTSPNSMSLKVDTGTTTVKKGDVFTIGGVYDVHPETKQSTGTLKQFTVMANFTGAGTITISPAIIATGRYQNCSTGAANNQKLTFIGAASTAYKRSFLFERGFAAFGTADLVLPPNTQASRANYDGLSIRLIVDAYDVKTDKMYTRLDLLYGYKVLRPDLGCTIWHT